MKITLTIEQTDSILPKRSFAELFERIPKGYLINYNNNSVFIQICAHITILIMLYYNLNYDLPSYELYCLNHLYGSICKKEFHICYKSWFFTWKPVYSRTNQKLNSCCWNEYFSLHYSMWRGTRLTNANLCCFTMQRHLAIFVVEFQGNFYKFLRNFKELHFNQCHINESIEFPN